MLKGWANAAFLVAVIGLSACDQGQRDYPDQRSLERLEPGIRLLGEQHYADFCASCHGADGAGEADLYPPLVGSDILNADRQALIEFMVTLKRSDPPRVTYPPSMGRVDYLPAEDLAALLSYVSYAFSDAPDPFSVSEVKPYLP